MAPNLNCMAASAVLWATIPSMGLSKTDAFAFHDANDSFVDSVIIDMKLPAIAVSNQRHIITGPLTEDQASILTRLAEMGAACAVIFPAPSEEMHVERDYTDGGEAVLAAAEEEMGAAHEPFACEAAVQDFLVDLAAELGANVTVQDGVIVLDAQATADLLGSGMTIGRITEDSYETVPLTDFYAMPEDDAVPVEHEEPERSDVLIEAAVTITSDRNNQYGEPENSFPLIAAYWSAHLGVEISAHDVAIMMTLMKISRMEAGYKRDSYIDAAGYIGIAGELAKGDFLARVLPSTAIN